MQVSNCAIIIILFASEINADESYYKVLVPSADKMVFDSPILRLLKPVEKDCNVINLGDATDPERISKVNKLYILPIFGW